MIAEIPVAQEIPADSILEASTQDTRMEEAILPAGHQRSTPPPPSPPSPLLKYAVLAVCAALSVFFLLVDGLNFWLCLLPAAPIVVALYIKCRKSVLLSSMSEMFLDTTILTGVVSK